MTVGMGSAAVTQQNANVGLDLEAEPRRQTASIPADSLKKKRTALIVVDIQAECWSQNDLVRNAFPNLPQNVEKLLKYCRENDKSEVCNCNEGASAEPEAKVPLIIHVIAEYCKKQQKEQNQYVDSPHMAYFKELNPEKVNIISAEWGHEEFAKPSADAITIPANEEVFNINSQQKQQTQQQYGTKKQMQQKPKEFVLHKTCFDAFQKTPLEQIFKDFNIEQTLICGMMTSACVQATAHSAFARGFRPVLINDCLADRSEFRHKTTLDLYGGYMYKVVDSVDDLIRDLEAE